MSVVELDVPGALVNQRLLFLKGFGLAQCMFMGMLEFYSRCLNTVSRFFGFKFRVFSLKSAASASNADYRVENDPNGSEFID